jgi:hypothetical protein
MHFGIQLFAPLSFDGIRAEVRYYFAGHSKCGSTHLVWFGKTPAEWRAHVVTMPRARFVSLLSDEPPKLKPHDLQLSLPEWLADVEGINFDELEGERPKEVVPYRKQASARLMIISDAVEGQKEILDSANPLKKLSALAYAMGSSTHPYRIQLWFFAYLLHGENLWALKKPTHGIGTWSRSSDKHKETKFGLASSDANTSFNAPSGPHAQACVNWYLAECGEGVTMRSIWLSFLKSRGVRITEDQHGHHLFYHPNGAAILSYGQFRYRVVDALTLEVVQKAIYGAARVRSKAKSDAGNFTEQYGNILEAFEVDAYFCSDLPKAMFSNAPAERLAVARGICAKTNEICGVGFSIGSETGEAYRAMLFCAAVAKTYIAKIYGIPQKHFAKWHDLGGPPNLRSDRGPAGHKDLVRDLEHQFPMKSVVPSYSGQSKAQVESGHPRDVHLEGAPSFVQSDLNIVQMMKRELFRANSDNHSSDISDRLSYEEIEDFHRESRLATPHDYAGYLLQRLATVGRRMTIEQAVRAYWTETRLTVDKSGVKCRGRHFNSDAFRAIRIQEQFGAASSMEFKGFILSAVFSTIWIEVKGVLVEVTAQARGRVDSQDLDVPLSQADESAANLKVIRARTRASGAAAEMDAHNKFEEETGKEWGAGTRRGGTPNKKVGTGKHEGEVAKGRSRVKKAA